MKAVWKETILAESDDTLIVGGKHFFPPDAIHAEYFEESDYRSTDERGGEAQHMHVVVDGERGENLAWYYPEPGEDARQITNYVTFADEVEISA